MDLIRTIVGSKNNSFLILSIQLESIQTYHNILFVRNESLMNFYNKSVNIINSI